MSKVCVIGDGGWGTALACVLQRNGHEVTVWGPFQENIDAVAEAGENTAFLPGVKLSPDITWTTDRAAAVAGIEAVLVVVPSKFFREVMQSFSGLIPDTAPLISATKGFDQKTHQRMSEVAEDVLGRGPVAVLSGPSHAEEVALGIPSAVSIACPDLDLAHRFQAIFSGEAFRVYTLTDAIGAELGGAMKNVMAIAAGVCDGIGYGDNTKAALITRGLAEMTRLGMAMGAEASTFSGLSGMGDLIVTCTSKHSRNRSVGERLGRGETTEEILGSMAMVAEGVPNSANAHDLAKKLGVEVPITEEVYAIVHEGKNPKEAVKALLTREPKEEM
ncbi:MAG: NAD(P)H-dependent glycerol-3-phosphate dehydrogenase [Verrucomicrobiota bacterium]